MSEPGSSTLSTSNEEGSIVQGVPQLPEAVVEVTDFLGHYGGDWRRVKEVEGIYRTDKGWWVATARVHVVVSDRQVWNIVGITFSGCSNLVKVTAPFVEKVGEEAFNWVYNLRHVKLCPDVVVKPKALICCLSMRVLAASVGFELDTGDRLGSGNRNDPTVGITRFAKWRN